MPRPTGRVPPYMPNKTTSLLKQLACHLGKSHTRCLGVMEDGSVLQESLFFHVQAGFCQTFHFLVACRFDYRGVHSLLSMLSTSILEVKECEERGVSLIQPLSASSEE